MSRLVAGWFATAFLLALATTTFVVVDPIRYVVAAAYRRASSSPSLADLQPLILGQIGWTGIAVMAATLVFGCAVAILEWRTGGLSRVIATEGRASNALFLAAVLWFGHSYLLPGHLLMGDLGNHIALVATRLRAVLAGTDPYWTNFQYLGQPLPEFYGPTTFWPITWLAVIVGDPTFATKLFLLLMHAASGVGAYRLARELGQGRVGGWVAGLIYAGSFAHLHLILYRGTVPQAVSVALLPIAFLLLRRVVRSDGWVPRAAWQLAAVVSLLLANYTPFGLVAGLFMAVYATILLLPRPERWSRLVPLAGAAVFAGVLAAWVVLPAFLASRADASISADRVLSVALPSREMLDHLLVWRAWRTNHGHDSSAYLGITAIALAVFGTGRALASARWRREAFALLALLVLSLLARGDFLRTIVLTLLPLAVLAGIGADAAMDRWRHWRSAPALIIGLLLLDLGPTAIQPLARTDLGAIDAAGQALAELPGRTVEGDSARQAFEASGGGGAGILQLYPAEFIVGGYTQLASPARDFAELAAASVERDLASAGVLSPATSTMLCQLRVRRVVASNRTSMGLPPAIPATEQGPLGRALAVDCGYDVVFAPAIESAVPSSGLPTAPQRARTVLDQVNSRMRLDPRTGVAARILLAEATLPSTRAGARPATKPEVQDYVVRADRVRVELTSAAPGFVRLSHDWDPRQQVTRNGQAVSSMPDIMDLTVVPIEAGRSVIEIRPGAPPGQAAGRAISAAALLVLAFGLLGPARRRTSPEAHEPRAGGDGRGGAQPDQVGQWPGGSGVVGQVPLQRPGDG